MAKRLGLGHRTVVSHGIHGGRTEVNLTYLRRLSPRHGLSSFGFWTSSEELNVLIILFTLGFNGLGDHLPPLFWLLPPPFILTFLLPHTSMCRFRFLGLILVLSAHIQSGWGWL